MKSRREFYILEGRVPVPASLMEWAGWLEGHHAERIVQQDTIDDYWISTVFLGMDHNWFEGPPLLFETMIFRGDDRADLYCQRYSTWELAVEGHRRAALLLKMGQLPKVESDESD